MSPTDPSLSHRLDEGAPPFFCLDSAPPVEGEPQGPSPGKPNRPHQAPFLLRDLHHQRPLCRRHPNCLFFTLGSPARSNLDSLPEGFGSP